MRYRCLLAPVPCRGYRSSCLTEEDAGAERGDVICPRSHNEELESGFRPHAVTQGAPHSRTLCSDGERDRKAGKGPRAIETGALSGAL